MDTACGVDAASRSTPSVRVHGDQMVMTRTARWTWTASTAREAARVRLALGTGVACPDERTGSVGAEASRGVEEGPGTAGPVHDAQHEGTARPGGAVEGHLVVVGHRGAHRPEERRAEVSGGPATVPDAMQEGIRDLLGVVRGVPVVLVRQEDRVDHVADDVDTLDPQKPPRVVDGDRAGPGGRAVAVSEELPARGL